jgi:YD repeat-containing protein
VRYNASNYRYFNYDAYGRASNNYHKIGQQTLRNYDNYSGSRHASHKYGLFVREYYIYDDYGNVIATRHNNTPLWELLETNARGQVVRERRSGIVTTYTYDNAGRVLSFQVPAAPPRYYGDGFELFRNALCATCSISR